MSKLQLSFHTTFALRKGEVAPATNTRVSPSSADWNSLMDFLKQIVRINESGIVADAVNFSMMDDEEKNLNLCKGFVFNYSQEAIKSSTLA